jgi:hypothetical protein
MSELTRDERKRLVESGEGWKLGDEARLLFPQCDQSDITRLPGLLVHYAALSEADRQRIKQRAITAALRQGFKLPPSLQKEVATMNQREREALKSIAGVIAEHGAVIFSEEGRDDADDVDEARRQAERFVDSLRGGRTTVEGDDHEDVRREAERFAADFNRRHGSRK